MLYIAESFGGWGFMARNGDAVYEDERISALWEIERTLKYPESTVYDPTREMVYVSNVANGGTSSSPDSTRRNR